MTAKKILQALVLTFFLIISHQARCQESLEGEWWITIKGKTDGAAKFVFSDLVGGNFKVAGHGTALSLGTFFSVAPNQSLQRASNGNISGVLSIENEDGDPLGSFDFDKGSVNKDATELRLRGVLANGTAERVKLIGKRFPSEEPVLTGLTQDARVRGKGLKSKFYELLVVEDAAEPFSGFPFFLYSGVGPVKVDGVETEDVEMRGRVVVDPRFKAFGTFFSDAFGDGPASGILRQGAASKWENNDSDIPHIRLVADADRKVKLKGKLEIAVSPRIAVDPTGTLNFGSVETETTETLSFTVTNAGMGTLSGSATLDGDPAYEITGGSPYSLTEGESTSVEISFSPTAAGTFTADVTFTGGGGASRSVTGTGTDADGNLSVEPESRLIFGNVLVGIPSIRSFTVTNTGTSQLDGQASIAGDIDFRLLTDTDVPVLVLPYSLAANQSRTIRVRFLPTGVGNFDAVVSFTGGDGAERSVDGTGIAP